MRFFAPIAALWQARRSVSPVFVVAAVLALVLGLLPVASQWMGGRQTWILSTRTMGATFTFQGMANAWPLTGVTLCEPLTTPLRVAPAETAGQRCDGRRYAQSQHDHRLFEWPDASAVELRAVPDGIEILFLSDAGGVGKGSLVHVPTGAFAGLGALGFTGSVEIGTLMSTGAKAFLLDGHYAVREVGAIANWRGWRSNTVKEGELTRGDVVSVVERSEPGRKSNGFGHISLAGGDDVTLEVVFLSSGQWGKLKIATFGQDHPTYIAPNWLERVLASPILIFVIFVSSLLGGFVQIFDALFRKSAER